MPASKKYHSNYTGGNWFHTFNTMICAKELYIAFHNVSEIFFKPLEFTLSKALYTAFCHDLTKYYQETRTPYRHHTKWSNQLFRDNNIDVEPDVINAMINHHGSYGSRNSKPCSLAYIIHFADTWASQVLEKLEEKPEE